MHRSDPTSPDPAVAPWRRASRWLVPVVLGLILAWNVARAWSATARGLDFSDEGFYLASARWFRHPELASTGAPALLGPLFHLVGLSVPWFRRLRIVLFVVTGAALGHATGRLIDDGSRPRRVDVALFGAIGSFTIYASLPQSSGYNDASVLCATVLATCTLRAWRLRGRGQLLWTAGAGAAAWFALLTKWPAGFVGVAVVTAVTAYVLGVRRSARLVAAAGAGAALAAVLVQVTSGDLSGMLRELRSTSSSITTQLPPWNAYFVPYRENLLGTLGGLLRGSGLLPLVFTGVMVLHQRATSRWIRHATAVTAGAASAWLCWFAVRDGLLRGGSAEVDRQLKFVPLLVLAALALWFARGVTAPVGRELGAAPVERSLRGPAVIVLIGLAGAQAVGTLNPPLYVIGFAGGLVFVATATICAMAERRLRPVARTAAVVLLAGAALAPSVLFQTGAWRHPYRNTNDLGRQQTAVHAEPFDGVSLDAPTAALLEQLRRLADDRGLVGRPGLSLFATPGLAYALGLTPPLVSLFVRTSDIGSTTYPLFEARVRSACQRSFISSAEPPVLLTVATTPDTAVQQILRGCGVDFPGGYTMVSLANPGLVDVPAGDIRVWIPT